MVFKVVTLIFLGLSLSFCGSTPKEEDSVSFEHPKYEKYSSSGVYQDIEGESRSVSSTQYSDDDYGDVEGGAEEGDLYMDEGSGPLEDDSEPLSMGSEPMPVEEETKAAPAPKAISKKFKNGMYKFKSNCTMRSQPSKTAAKAGTVSKGKKLWVEAHNAQWVKIYKKSGAVYINKVCL